MLPKKYRLLRDKDFQKIWKSGKSFYGKAVGFKVLKNDLGALRFGIVCGSKVSKNATVRNKIKRQIREIIRSKINQIAPGYDIVLTALPQSPKKTYQEIKTEVLSGLKHFKILKS